MNSNERARRLADLVQLRDYLHSMSKSHPDSKVYRDALKDTVRKIKAIEPGFSAD